MSLTLACNGFFLESAATTGAILALGVTLVVGSALLGWTFREVMGYGAQTRRLKAVLDTIEADKGG